MVTYHFSFLDIYHLLFFFFFVWCVRFCFYTDSIGEAERKDLGGSIKLDLCTSASTVARNEVRMTAMKEAREMAWERPGDST